MRRLFLLAATTTLIFTQSLLANSHDDSSLQLRLRSHFTSWDWVRETDVRRDNWAWGIGGMVGYKTPSWHHLYAYAAYYFSRNPWHMDRSDLPFIKSGKDMFCRYKVAKGGSYAMDILALAYIGYKSQRIDLQAGRILFDSMLVKANDTKMIPNAFEGVRLQWRSPLGRVLLGYLERQKLRDKTFFHDVVTYGKDLDGDGVLRGLEKWRENDDAGANHALSYVNLRRAHKETDHQLLVAQLDTRIAALRISYNTTVVPGLFGLFAIEPRYSRSCGDTTLYAAARAIIQRDLGARDLGRLGIAVANLKAKGAGYKNPYSVDGALWMAKAGVKRAFWDLQLAYSQVADRADIIDPWRGFPTGGYTRARAQYNWYANTKTWMVQAKLDLQEAGVVPGLMTLVRWSVQDFDDAKSGVQADANTLEVDFVKHFGKNLYVKLRLGHTRGDGDTVDIEGHRKSDPSFDELRFEISYSL